MTWLSISTAPKDGTWILAHEPGMDPSRFVTQWVTFKDGFGDQYTGWVWPDVGETGPNLCSPTHWQPLEDEPKELHHG